MTYQALYSDLICPYQPAKERSLHRQNGYTTLFCPNQTRTLFGFTHKPKRRPKPANFKPGFETMLKLNEMLRLGERTPPSDELVEAFVALFKSQQKTDGGYTQLEDAQIGTAILTFEHLQKTNTNSEGFGIPTDGLRMALRILERGSSKAHKKMATLIYKELETRRQFLIDQEHEADPVHVDLVPYIAVLCRSDGSLLARDLVEKHWMSDLRDAKVLKVNGTRDKSFEMIGASVWMRVLQGLIREKLNDEVEKTIQIMQKHDVPFDSKLHATVVNFYARYEGNMEMTKKWYEHPIAGDGIPTNAADASVLKLCITKNELEWGEPILTKLVERNPQDKASWNVILQWAAAKGRGVDEIEHMMEVMEKRNPDKPKLQPGMDTINALIELANIREDPYTAERYYALGEKWGFQPNARTYLLQLDYRIKVKDLSGAMAAYRRLQGETISENEDIPYINKLIVAFCSQADLRYDTIMSLVEDLTERQASFYPDTVSALSLLHVHRNDMMDLVDLLNTHTFHYSLSQRASVHNALLACALGPETSEVHAWELYNNLCSILPELMDLATRGEVMVSFFVRGRPDMATIVFSHMREQKDKTLRPTIHTYCTALIGLSQIGDLASVETIHNMMKVDSEIEPNTKLYNALILAYTSMDRPDRALSFWQDIAHSREGPSYNSIQLAFRACERASSGEQTAREIWAKLKREDVEIPREVFAAYIGAIAGSEKFDECVDLLAEAEAVCGVPVDALM